MQRDAVFCLISNVKIRELPCKFSRGRKVNQITNDMIYF